MGCPQGGVLSVLLWIIAFDELLNSFGVNDMVEIVGYAGDACILINGDDLPMMYKTMNLALSKAQRWASNHGLTICPKKTAAVIFHATKKQYKTPITTLTLNNRTINIEKKIKYLGVTLDSHLNWTAHITDKVERARKLIFKIRSTCRKLWGP